MEWLIEKKLTGENIEFFGDSNLSVQQMNGIWKAKRGMYFDHYQKAIKLKIFFKNICFYWIPREQNEMADALSRQTLDLMKVSTFYWIPSSVQTRPEDLLL